MEQAIDRLREQGHVYEADGAVWLRTTDFGDDKDRVLVKSDGEPTYFAADCAYYLDKRERGFDRCVDHARRRPPRLRRPAARRIAALRRRRPGRDLEMLIGQLVNLVRDGEPVRMSKRAGTVVTLEDLVDAVGVDAARYALARSSVDQHDRPRPGPAGPGRPTTTRSSTSSTRTPGSRSLLRNAADLGHRPGTGDVDAALLGHEREGDLLRALGEFPRVVAVGRRAARAAPGGALPGGAGRHLPPVLRLLPGAAAAATRRPPTLTAPGCWLCAATAQVLAQRPRPARRHRAGADVSARAPGRCAARRRCAPPPGRPAAAPATSTRWTPQRLAARRARGRRRAAASAASTYRAGRGARHPAVRARRGRLPRPLPRASPRAFGAAPTCTTPPRRSSARAGRPLGRRGGPAPRRLQRRRAGRRAGGRLPGRADRAARQQQVARRARPRPSTPASGAIVSTPSTRSTGCAAGAPSTAAARRCRC